MAINHIELFAGLGGFRTAMQLVSASSATAFVCRAFSEIEPNAVRSYRANFDTDNEIAMGDIVTFTENAQTLETLPHVDLVTGGFPCQSFSMMGGQRGFEDPRGNLFFNILRVIRQTTPPFVLLENVKNLKTHDGGNTFRVIRESIEGLGYHFFADVFNTADFGLAQTRNRVYMFATTQGMPCNFEFTAATIKAFFDERLARNLFLRRHVSTHDVLDRTVPQKYYLSDKLKRTILSNGSGGFVSKSDIDLLTARPLCATMHKMHRACQDNYFSQGFINRELKGPTSGREAIRMSVRKLTPREAFRLQGFPEQYFNNLEVLNLSDTALYKLAGNAVSVNVVYGILSYLATVFNWR